ncbi:dihydrodipicolinate synthase family protein [Boseongicola aestuarii]|jgi:4-hydroxy-tetrahydrodipicolinate synthase|uniref:4-hydroxy-tetrahydrodipicolinate synthase n=1 Tax=Boseongicola aestuarii TaxID=1470561 RepID=A0A238J2V3_9RHOB|nr:dihydrodipicolinate synthase family protein [Boseongicola aestuarii]SMX24224.1 4-hydroxy-tetrahydrodipicolinate synthase [Boseongicola aestuarii]
MLDESAKGVFTIAATPFLPNGALDIESLDTMTDFYMEKGATGLTILGIMGEAGKLSAGENATVIERICARATVPVIVGVSAPGFAQIEATTEVAMAKGAAGVMVAPPSSLRTDAQITGYYRTLGERLGKTPWVIQDFPLVTDVQVDPKVILQIVEDNPACVMLKHEDWPGLEKIAALRAASDAGSRRISILCGNGGQFLLEEMIRGADGAMTGFAYPEMMRDVTTLMSAGDESAARDIFDAYLPLVRYESQPGLGLAIRKYILAKRGAIAHATVRAPGPKLSKAAIAEIETLIERQQQRLAAL